MRIVDGARSNCPRRLFVTDAAGRGTSIVYTGDNNDELLVDSGDESEDDVLVDSSDMKSCTWWIGEDEHHCILEARDKDGGYLWSGTILGKPTSKEYIHGLVGGPPVQGKEPKYEYKNVYLKSAQYSVDVNRMYKLGWEPVCCSMVYDKQLESTSALFTLRRRIN